MYELIIWNQQRSLQIGNHHLSSGQHFCLIALVLKIIRLYI